ncbi:unnamed protein product [Owenia fusiformis]|uniref:HEAT repeat protein n=1 Tax=Owenia fusiformis TaxID=6347 RepID=A0A8S4PIQ0_OWEFU|nr:unnamed protein product [Owenia fusiformis]
MVSDISLPWETKHGGLMGSKCLLDHSRNLFHSDFSGVIQDHALELLADEEFRVRIAAGEVMGALCKKGGPDVYAENRDAILEGIQTNLERQPLTEVLQQEDAEKLYEKLSSSPRSSGAVSPRMFNSGSPFGSRRGSANASQIFHDTAGWKNLETWMKCFQCVVEGCGPLFNPYIDQTLLDLIFAALTHTNRFVRETGYYVCATLVGCGLSQDGEVAVPLDEGNTILSYGHQFAEHLGNGLADNWSQVRLAASVATRKFCQSLGNDQIRSAFYPILIPRMCLNRYYVAEGVRIYSQDTWKKVAGMGGAKLVETYITETVEFYISQTEADNHAVREAACACIAELGTKIDKDVVRPFVPGLLDALLVCFKDDSWPVRDASCIACGNFLRCFAEESKGSLDALFPLFFENLQDNIPSVRQGAANALANVILAYGDEVIPMIVAKIKEGLAGIAKQPENAEKYSGLEKGPATYGVVKRARDNDMDTHSNQPMYSCGSLAPKMGRGGGCMDHQFKRPSEPWETADGCVHLVAEMAPLKDLASRVSELLPDVAHAATYHQYAQHVNFLETICKQLPNIARGLGKRPFKAHIELFLEPIFYSISCDNALTSSAAVNCLSQLSAYIGPGIMRGRVEQYNPRYLEQLDSLNIAPMPMMH